MQKISSMDEYDLKKQSVVFVTQSIISQWLWRVALVAFVLMIPMSVKSMETSLLIKLLVVAFFYVTLGWLYSDFFTGGRFYLAANENGWFFRSSKQRDTYMFVPWSECLDVRSVSSLSEGSELRIRMINSQPEEIPSPEKGSIAVRADHIDFNIGGFFNAKRVAEKLRRLMRDSNRLGQVDMR